MPFINKQDSSIIFFNRLTIVIFMTSFISLLEIINLVLHKAKSERQPDPNILLSIATSVVTAAVNTHGIKTVLAGESFYVDIRSK